jgi:hypothetical protein
MLFQPKTATNLIGSFAAVRELARSEGVDQSGWHEGCQFPA